MHTIAVEVSVCASLKGYTLQTENLTTLLQPVHANKKTASVNVGRFDQIDSAPSDANGSLDTSELCSTLSRPLEKLRRLHQEHDRDLRLIQSWTNRPSRLQTWELEAGAAKLVLSVSHRFLQMQPLRLHGILGESDQAPTFDTIITRGGSTDIPKDATYFIEDRVTKERLVFKAENRGGEIRLSFDAREPSERISALKQFATEHNYLRGEVFDLRGKILNFSSIHPDDIVLTEKQQTLIQRHVIEFANRYAQLRDRNAKLTRGVIFAGEPGCGKSMLIRLLTKQLNDFSVCLASPSQICSLGSVEVLDTIIRMTAPCAVIMEEIDLFGSDRGLFVNPGLAELMQLMDGLRTVPGVLWIGTTNRPEEVERALADRPGRFDRRIKFGPLEDEPRSILIDRLVRPQGLTSKAKSKMHSLTGGWTGAQIRELCETLRLISDADEFTPKVVEHAIADCGFDMGGTFGFCA